MSFQFRNLQQLEICGNTFTVIGGIEFENDGDIWQEYCLNEKKSHQKFWLCIDQQNDEYAIYHTEHDSTKFSPGALKSAGFHQVEITRGQVINTFGDVDVERGDRVKSTMYEDATEEHIMSIEQWDDELEYSSGYYLDWDEIHPASGSNFSGYVGGTSQDDYGYSSNNYSSNNYSSNGFSNPNYTQPQAPQSGNSGVFGQIIFYVIFFGIFGLAILGSCLDSCSCSGCSSQTAYASTTVSAHLKDNPGYTYETSVTSDLNDREFAYVYTTPKTVKSAAEDIITAIAESHPDVQESEDGNTVTILTPEEYAVVYPDKDDPQKTLVQVSARSYAYESSNGLHNASEQTNSHYRGFYFIRGYDRDRARYTSRRHGYNNYSTRTIYNPNNSYQSYANQRYKSIKSARQQSRSTRSHSSSSSSRMGK